MFPTMYQYTRVIQTLFKTHEDVKQISQFWAFMEGDFLNGIYWEEWYNEGSDPTNFQCPGHVNATGKGLKL